MLLIPLRHRGANRCELMLRKGADLFVSGTLVTTRG